MKSKVFVVIAAVLAAACSDPFNVDSARAYIAVTAGAEHTCAVSEAGDAYCWGRGTEGQLGTGARSNEVRPTKVVGELDFDSISAGRSHTCALTAARVAYCWGANDHGQRGSAVGAADDEPVPVNTSLRFRSISAAEHHTCALAVDSLAYCWGRNDQGQVGNGALTDVNAPAAVSGGRRFVQLSTGGEHACGVTAAYAIFCWGRNDYGQVGDSSAVTRIAPVIVRSGGVELYGVDAGATHTCALGLTSHLFCWGSDVYGELGIGTAYDGKPGATQPILVSPNIPELGTGISIAAGKDHACAIEPFGMARCWGRGDLGHIGNGRLDMQFFPQPIHLQPLNLHFGDFFRVTRLAVGGDSHVCALAARRVYCWGMGAMGQLGVPNKTFAALPQQVVD
jgi:alpha-tubulin suppressor-like RCC1 family protein